ncbi:MAG: cation transporter [Phycisphaeraceae bacterium]|nr:MAG: cation transporter [Phycisphaeraceae bacterium]
MGDAGVIPGFRKAVAIVAVANFAYFFVEAGVGLRIGSVSLFADSVDFLEDAAVNVLILIALRMSMRARSRIGVVLALIILVPAAAALWTAWRKITGGEPPAASPLTLTGLGALAVNTACAFILVSHREHHGSLGKAAFFSARNDAIANIAIIAAGLVTLWRDSIWPDLVVGIGIVLINLHAAWEVFKAARGEHREEP